MHRSYFVGREVGAVELALRPGGPVGYFHKAHVGTLAQHGSRGTAYLPEARLMGLLTGYGPGLLLSQPLPKPSLIGYAYP
ncbi:hypothetical protein GCM10027175_03370 [Hymenobacter latericoloratus]